MAPDPVARANTWYAFVEAPAKMIYRIIYGKFGPLGCLFMVFPAMGITGLTIGVVKGAIPWTHVAAGVGAVCALTFVVFLVSRFLGKAKVARALLHPDPQELIALFTRSIAPQVPDYDAWRAYLSAIACAAYGDFDHARGLLAAIDWSARVPAVQSGALTAEAWIAYLGERDWNAGLERARKARGLSTWTGQPQDPGGSLLEAVGRTLAGQPETGDEGVLRAAAAGGLPLERPLAAWALAVCAHRAGRLDEREALLAAVRRHAPHCRPLLTVE